MWLFLRERQQEIFSHVIMLHEDGPERAELRLSSTAMIQQVRHSSAETDVHLIIRIRQERYSCMYGCGIAGNSRSIRGANFLKQATARSITPWLSPIVQNFPVSPEMAASKLWSQSRFYVIS